MPYLSPETVARALAFERAATKDVGPDGCDACGGVGFLHVETDNGPEVEACDACQHHDAGTEERAIRAHRISCGCDWPENAPDHPFYEGRTKMAIPTFPSNGKE
jgi:hypothetical protein